MVARELNLVPYDELRSLVLDGDLLLWRPVNIPGRLFCLISSIYHRQWTRHSHASMAAWAPNRRLYNLEMIQWVGGRHIPLSLQVAHYPQSCEIWRPLSDKFDGERAVHHMLWLMGQHYGWCDLLRIATTHSLPKLFQHRPVNSDDPDEPRVCSSAYAWAARTGGGIDPCPAKPDRFVTPADLALSGFAKYLATPIL